MKGSTMCEKTIGLIGLVFVFAVCPMRVGYGEEKPAPQDAAGASAPAAESLPEGLDADYWRKAKALMDGGATFLVEKREANQAWSAGRGAGVAAITGMALKALAQHPDYGPKHPVVRKGFEVLLSYKQPDGGIYAPREGGGSYTSAVALMALTAANDPSYAEPVRTLVAYLKGLQITPGSQSSDGKTVAEEDPTVGGVSYGKGPGRPDLSNVGMWAQALHDAGVGGDDPVMQRAAAFVSRLQNYSETNKMAWASEGANDGGFIYRFPGDGERKARSEDAVRSYGSMTYAGFKSLLYAGVDRKDPRVVAAFNWIRRYWRLDGNPNMPQAQSREGLYYYYHVFAKAMRIWGEPVVTDAKGVKHNWRRELIDVLAKQVCEDGSWVNEAGRWWESNPVLTTCYSLLALEEAIRPSPAGSRTPKAE
jgi:squalene-hopene/tetraprenyl-beta-curcumene cyclase